MCTYWIGSAFKFIYDHTVYRDRQNITNVEIRTLHRGHFNVFMCVCVCVCVFCRLIHFEPSTLAQAVSLLTCILFGILFESPTVLRHFVVLLSPSKQIPGSYFVLRHDRFLPRTVEFIIRQLFYHSILYTSNSPSKVQWLLYVPPV